jgi:hypothetical protein
MFREPFGTKCSEVYRVKRIPLRVNGFSILHSDVHTTAYTTISTGRTYPFVRGFLFGYFSEDGVIYESVFVCFDVKA